VENDERSSSSYLKGKSLYKGIFSRVTLDDELFQLESDVIRKVAKQGDCIIVGWCGNHILQEEETIDVFLYASDLGSVLVERWNLTDWIENLRRSR